MKTESTVTPERTIIIGDYINALEVLIKATREEIEKTQDRLDKFRNVLVAMPSETAPRTHAKLVEAIADTEEFVVQLQAIETVYMWKMQMATEK